MSSSQIQIELLEQSYRVRVVAGEEERVRHLARLLDDRLEAFIAAHPGRAHLTAAIMTAFSLIDEVDRAHRARQDDDANVAQQVTGLADLLADVLTEPDEEEA